MIRRVIRLGYAASPKDGNWAQCYHKVYIEQTTEQGQAPGRLCQIIVGFLPGGLSPSRRSNGVQVVGDIWRVWIRIVNGNVVHLCPQVSKYSHGTTVERRCIYMHRHSLPKVTIRTGCRSFALWSKWSPIHHRNMKCSMRLLGIR